MTTSLPYLPTEITNMIFDYKEAMEAKDTHNARTILLKWEMKWWASRPFHNHFTNDIWWWMTEDGTKLVRPAIYQDEETGKYEEDFGYNPAVDDSDDDEEDLDVELIEVWGQDDIFWCKENGKYYDCDSHDELEEEEIPWDKFVDKGAHRYD